jgi:hypothetical protein
MSRRRVLIVFDPLVVASWSDACRNTVLYLFERALAGHDYARERGVDAIEFLPEGETVDEAEQRLEQRGYARAERDIIGWLRRMGKPRTAEHVRLGSHRERP